MKDEEAEARFRAIRWSETNGKPVCPHYGSLDAYDCRRLKGAPRFPCKGFGKDFSITSGTLFASHKLPLRCYLAAIAIFCNEVKGKSALASPAIFAFPTSARSSSCTSCGKLWQRKRRAASSIVSFAGDVGRPVQITRGVCAIIPR
jgi:transposase-like protein